MDSAELEDLSPDQLSPQTPQRPRLWPSTTPSWILITSSTCSSTTPYTVRNFNYFLEIRNIDFTKTIFVLLFDYNFDICQYISCVVFMDTFCLGTVTNCSDLFINTGSCETLHLIFYEEMFQMRYNII